MSQGLYDAAPAEVLECRPIAIRFAKEIGEVCNRKFGLLGAQRAALTASLTLQNIVVSIVIDLHAAGSEEGEAFIRNCYESAMKDAVERWHARDLKHHFGDKPRKL